jgi:hypothetical protein
MKKTVFTLLLTLIVNCLLSIVECKAQESQTIYNFLRLPVSAHAAALGGDNITLAEDDEAQIFQNPALLHGVSDKTLHLGFMNYMQGSYTANAAFNRTVGERGAWAVSGQFMDYGTMKEVDENNIATGDFSARDIAITGYYSHLLAPNLSGGIAAKFINSHIASYNSMAVAVDLGVNYYKPESGLSASLVAKNLGGQINAYDDEYERLPFDLQAGVSKRLVGTPLRFSGTLVDLTHWDYKFIHHLAAGIDLLLSEQIWIGAGYNFRRAHEMNITTDDVDNESAHGAGLSLGAGLALERFKLHLAYGKYHVSSHSLILNLAINL